ncbi:GCN5-like N-acetyltransferase [Gloeomargarita lithophora Alchichica-D10]|uniref:GCN5-like N-acetyltransferase n=1 Tax=Gloeomargarita lithophora Alchichica-D10 TaxID=1188229 RepID=A0A1J0AGU4_9CYAN|nr:GNAT family N-acetyltransferase [Gloeomargarita lithophora]APB35169.1 GCN5-like N-acetyltransferase [Gloeomargarita lithophora Alchichica-D10]
MKPEIVLRPASINDLEILRRWDELPHVIESDPNDDWEWEIELNRDPPWREQFMAEIDGKPFGFLQIIDPTAEESHYWGGVSANLRAIDIWIGEEKYLGQGLGTAMMRWALAHCFAVPAVEAVLIDPLERNVRARRFYERLGFVEVEKRRFGSDDCVVYRLERSLWVEVP